MGKRVSLGVDFEVVIATRLTMPKMGRQKAGETLAHRTVRLEGERDQQTSSYLCFLVSVVILSRTSVFFASHFTQTHIVLHKAQHVHSLVPRLSPHVNEKSKGKGRA